MAQHAHSRISRIPHPGIGQTLLFLPRMIGHWIEVRRQRHQLARLEPDQLRDIGISQEEARDEVQRPFWNAPPHWLR